MHSESTRARMPYNNNFSAKKSLRSCLSKTKPYARACCRIRNCRDFQKKGKRKPTCHYPSLVYSLPSLEVFTFRIVLNCILHKSSLLAPLESFVTSHSHISFIGRKRLRTQSLVGADLGQLVYTYKRVVCVCLFVCWFVCFLSATRHLSTLRRCLRVAERAGAAVAGGPARPGKHALVRARARMPYNFSKNHCAAAFQKQKQYTRAHAVVYVTADKKREKENQHATSQVQFTVCLLLECLLFESY